jgi:hypothetical protein
MSSVFSALGVETALVSRRFRLFAVGALIGAVLLLLAAGFLAFAAYLALLAALSPWQAALVVGVCALAFGGLLLVVAMKSLSRAAEQVQEAVKSNVLVRAAPVAARLAIRSPRLIVGVAALAAAVLALMRALGERPKKAGS